MSIVLYLDADELNSRRLRHTAFANSLAVLATTIPGPGTRQDAAGQTAEGFYSQWHAQRAQMYRRELTRRSKGAK